MSTPIFILGKLKKNDTIIFSSLSFSSLLFHFTDNYTFLVFFSCRQIRGFGFSTSNIVEDDNKIVSWMTGNETQTSLDLNKACNNKGSSKNQSIIPIYISDKKSKNTNTFSPLTGQSKKNDNHFFVSFFF